MIFQLTVFLLCFVLVPKYHTSVVDGIHNQQRDINDKPLPLTLSITLADTILNFNVSLDYSFIANTYITQYVGENGIYNTRVGNIGEFSSGKMHDDENSYVALHHREDGIVGSYILFCTHLLCLFCKVR